MATPKIVTDGDTPFDEANMNKFVAGDGTKIQIKIWYATVIYSGGNLIVKSSADSCGLVTGDLSYNTGTDYLEITLGGFTNSPQVQVSRLDPGTNYVPTVLYVDNTEVDIGFYDPTDLSAQETPGAPDANMNFNILIIGY